MTFLFLGLKVSFFTHDYNKNLNLMSSWGWGTKFSNLQQVGDFSIFGSKSSHVQRVILNRIFLFLIFD